MSMALGLGLGLPFGGQTSAAAPVSSAYTGLVAQNCCFQDNYGSAAPQVMSRSSHLTTDTVTTIGVAFANFQVTDQYEKGNDNSMVMRASIEYPAGTIAAQLTFSLYPDSGGHPGDTTYALIPSASSGATGESTNAAMVVSDLATVSIPSGTRFWVRWWSNCAGGMGYNASISDGANGDGFTFGNGSAGNGNDLTSTSGSVTASGFFSRRPTAIIGNTNVASVICVGSSITQGFRDTAVTATDKRRGHIQRGIPLTTASINLAGAGARAETFLTYNKGRKLLWPYCSHWTSDLSFNDIETNSRTSTQLLTDNQTIAATLRSGVRLLQTTMTCYVVSSDGCITLGNQTVQNGPAGTPGTAEYYRIDYNTTLRNSKPAWIYGVLDVCGANGSPVLESSFNSGKQSVSPSPPYFFNDATNNFYHPNAAGNLLSGAYVATTLATLFAYP